MAKADELVHEAYQNAVANGNGPELEAMSDYQLAVDMSDRVYELDEYPILELEKVVHKMRNDLKQEVLKF